jgi:glycerophosphoryl diester phosphodiesterase
MAAFRKARELGSPGIELDVHLCVSGELVVAHDDTFIRTAPKDRNGGGRLVEEMTLGEIRSLDIGSFFNPAFSGERAPLLEEVLEEFCPRMYVDIELKTRKLSSDPLPGLVAEKLKTMGRVIEAAVTVSSFNPFSIAAFKSCSPGIPTAVIYSQSSEVPWILRRGAGRFIAGCDYVKPVRDQVNPRTRFCITALEGRPMIPWTVDDPAEGERLLTLGCAGIITNCPQNYPGMLL